MERKVLSSINFDVTGPTSFDALEWLIFFTDIHVQQQNAEVSRGKGMGEGGEGGVNCMK